MQIIPDARYKYTAEDAKLAAEYETCVPTPKQTIRKVRYDEEESGMERSSEAALIVTLATVQMIAAEDLIPARNAAHPEAASDTRATSKV
mmetsp:Transcript_90018/g.169695  ORF Transcript_90018/g.169695 Transcript_90018/m.169695 type:complete len:90 (-) Transcript_90018:66-335(-)